MSRLHYWERGRDGYTNYREKDLLRKGLQIAKARELWEKRTLETRERIGKDIGSCVRGAGICVNLIPPRKREPRRHMIIGSPGVGGQGSVMWEESAEDIVTFLKSWDVDCYFEHGNMD